MLYFDTSFLVPMVFAEPTSDRIERFLTRQIADELAVSYWTRLEFSSMLAQQVRMRILDPQAALEADAQFDAMVNGSFVLFVPRTDDYELARRYLQEYRTGLRAVTLSICRLPAIIVHVRFTALTRTCATRARY